MFFPKTVNEFNCLAGICSDNCCRNSVRLLYVDSDTHEKYKNLSGESGEVIRASLEEVDDIVKFKALENGRCPHLDEYGFCNIQIQMGEEYLCNSCKNFPRKAAFFNGTLEPTLHLSCPEAVKCLLFGDNRLELAHMPTEGQTSPAPAPFEADEYKIRSMLLDIVQYDWFTLKDKLVYMGVFMRTLAKLPKDNNFSAGVDTTIGAYRKQMGTAGLMGELHKSLTGLDTDVRNNALVQILKVAASVAASHKDTTEDIENAEYYMLVSNFGKALDDENIATQFLEAYDKLIVPYINANTNVFTSYLMYNLHDKKFPKGADDYASAYTAFLGEFITQLLFAAGVFHASTELTHEEMTAAIYLFHRKTIGYPDFRTEIAQVFQSTNLAIMLGILGNID